jgi:N-acetylglucosaminyldiphosphoundecaprenol N-acetyl-beta-D-mannosaminyltransferase
MGDIRLGRGGSVIPVNIDVSRLAAGDRELHHVISAASLVVPDGMPLLWAAKLRGSRFPERVAGASLIYSLSGAAAQEGRSIYLLGGAPGIPGRAAAELCARNPGLKVAGTDAPPLGFDASDEGVQEVCSRLAMAAPDIVFVGLGCPKQERLIARIAPSFPAAWFIACGAAIPFAAKAKHRAPRWMRQAGLSWLFRLATEPRRLFKRYVFHDMPYAARLLTSSAAERIRR